jgi:branched-subunit amino acid aminotransferase/4-amino-4-deoxychorismate lyase
MCFYGSEGMGLRADGLKTHVMVAAWEWPSYMDPGGGERGIKVRTSSFTRHHVNITMCKAKANGNYINSMLALREALDSAPRRPCCSTTRATWPRAAARTCSSCAAARCTRRS